MPGKADGAPMHQALTLEFFRGEPSSDLKKSVCAGVASTGVMTWNENAETLDVRTLGPAR